MTLIFINRFFFPDHSATSQMLSDLAFALAAHGKSVHVITSRQRYDAPNERLPPHELIEGVHVHRVWTTQFGRHNLLGRTLDYVTFYLAAAIKLGLLARRGDVVIAKTDPPMMSVVAGPVARLRGARLVNWLQDIFPEVATATGLGSSVASRTAFAIMKGLRDRSLRRAHVNVVVGQRMASRIAGLGIERAKIRVATNWADGTAIRPIDKGSNALRDEWGLSDAFVVGYSGNLGRAHEFETFLEAIAETEQRPSGTGLKIVWLFIGGGALYEKFRREVARRRLGSVQFQAYQPRERLAESLSAADVHLISLRPELEGLVVPSKYYGIAAAGRPTIFIGDANGEIASSLAVNGTGTTVAIGDGAGLAMAVTDLAADPARAPALGQRARALFEREFDRRIAIARWEMLLDEVAAGSG